MRCVWNIFAVKNPGEGEEYSSLFISLPGDGRRCIWAANEILRLDSAPQKFFGRIVGWDKETTTKMSRKHGNFQGVSVSNKYGLVY
jgi:hypothetical protein